MLGRMWTAWPPTHFVALKNSPNTAFLATNLLASYTFCCFEKQSKHCFPCHQLVGLLHILLLWKTVQTLLSLPPTCWPPTHFVALKNSPNTAFLATNLLASYTFCCFEKQSKHCFPCHQLVGLLHILLLWKTVQTLLSLPPTCYRKTNNKIRGSALQLARTNRPHLLSITEDLAKFGHSHVSDTYRHLQSSATQSLICT